MLLSSDGPDGVTWQVAPPVLREHAEEAAKLRRREEERQASQLALQTAVFAVMDQDGDGLLDCDEIQEALGEFGVVYDDVMMRKDPCCSLNSLSKSLLLILT